MPFVELFAPKGALDGERGRRVKERLVAEVMQAEGAPDNEAAREISWLVVNEPQEWFVGGRPIAGQEQPRYVVRVSVRGRLARRRQASRHDPAHHPGPLRGGGGPAACSTTSRSPGCT
ncbi:hypothetical protein [Nonomuraea dietziae]|uniref:hypothetical protein n=1 Tax=Nonomuraea dietziae TaxID=65515 RepID=UPI0031D4C6C8